MLPELNIDLSAHLQHFIKPRAFNNKWLVNYQNVLIDTPDEDHAWVMVLPKDRALPRAGWKIHISAVLEDAVSILQAVLPILFQEKVAFKFSRTLKFLATLNMTEQYSSQAGKFITIYPFSEQNIIKICERLHQATQPWRGPQVLSDQAYKPRSLVHYRWGGFLSQYMQTVYGEIVPVAVTEHGKIIIDRRQAFYTKPKTITSPFNNHESEENNKPLGIFKRRYLAVQLLARSTRGDVLLAFDKETRRRCIIKIAFRDAYRDHYGRDACYRLKHEMDVLNSIQPLALAPIVYDHFFDANQNYVVVMEDIAGKTLDEIITTNQCNGYYPTHQETLAFAHTLAKQILILHAHEVIHTDIKCANTIIHDNNLRLIDFEMAYKINSDKPRFGRGTSGYASPQQLQGIDPARTDDIFALGATLYYFASLTKPAISRAGFNNPRSCSQINTKLSPKFDIVLNKCLHPDASKRYQSVAELIADLNKLAKTAPRRRANKQATSMQRCEYLLDARRVSDVLLESILNDGSRYTFASPATPTISLHDLRGSAGCILALSDLWRATNSQHYKRVLLDAVHSLPIDDNAINTIPGLYVGLSGIAYAVLYAGIVLHDDKIVNISSSYIQAATEHSHVSFDLFNGSAGRLRTAVCFWQTTQNPDYLTIANSIVDIIFDAAKTSKENILYWPLPNLSATSENASYDDKIIQFGYSHGMAGIADALLDFYLITHNQRALSIILRIAKQLLQHVSYLNPARTLAAWPVAHSESVTSPFWCHGAAGIGKFLVRLLKYKLIPKENWQVIKAAGLAAARNVRWALPTQCHGLSGNIEFLLDIYQLQPDQQVLDDAIRLYQILQTWLKNKHTLLEATPEVKSRDYMCGLPGIISCCLRMHNHQKEATQISVERILQITNQ